ncbi:MAG: LytTR family DNA-binding domain-containing protein [Lachnospiraceae bacterium]|jgi:Response regulator of the LytR/AlgR family|nr:response regulator transcription factor [Lachnospiraceae bacterium]MCI8827043.1 response regulator transcription factor [Lachnospiraceae bacterium]MCI9371119.1 response regulator transcription factor [Lachnospiraceae bacterium]
MKIAIIEDIQSHGDLLTSYIKKWSVKNKTTLILKRFETAESFLFQWEEEADFDILFVDIQMSGMNGIEMAKKIRDKDKNIVIIFTTGLTDYIEEGYEVEAMHYLIKPVSETKLNACLDRAAEIRKTEKYILIHTQEQILKINTEQICYAEAMGHNCRLKLEKKDKLVEIKETLSQLEHILDKTDFIKCHRSYICRVRAIFRIDKVSVYFDDGSNIPVSRRMYEKVNQAFIQCFSKVSSV